MLFNGERKLSYTFIVLGVTGFFPLTTCMAEVSRNSATMNTSFEYQKLHRAFGMPLRVYHLPESTQDAREKLLSEMTMDHSATSSASRQVRISLDAVYGGYEYTDIRIGKESVVIAPGHDSQGAKSGHQLDLIYVKDENDYIFDKTQGDKVILSLSYKI